MARLGAEAAARLGLYPLVAEGLSVLAISHAVAGDFDERARDARSPGWRSRASTETSPAPPTRWAPWPRSRSTRRTRATARVRTPRRRWPSPSPTLPMEAREALITLARADVADGDLAGAATTLERAFVAAEKIGQSSRSRSASGWQVPRRRAGHGPSSRAAVRRRPAARAVPERHGRTGRGRPGRRSRDRPLSARGEASRASGPWAPRCPGPRARALLHEVVAAVPV